MDHFPIRINKYLSDKKIASRREADLLIQNKKVLVNNKIAVIGQQIQKDDEVTIKGTIKKYSYLAYYKGRGIITHSPLEHEVDIVTKIQKDYSLNDVNPIGRLDKDSEGLMILSNDGRITGPLCNPEANHEKEYEVNVDKAVGAMFAKLMSNGVDIEGYKTKPTTVQLSDKNSKKFNLTLTEGKKHQIRRMCAALGYQVKSLKRVRIANIKLGLLKPNQYRKIAGGDLKELMQRLGLSNKQ